MTSIRTLVASALTAAVVSAAGAAATTTTHKMPPSTGQDWISLGEGHEFQPAKASPGSSPQQQRALRQAQIRFLEESTGQQQQQTSFLDSTETYYDGYSQAWRYVGFYTDCSPDQEQRDRRLAEQEVTPCARYLLWAAVSTLLVDRRSS
jgi:hypothetical protein